MAGPLTSGLFALGGVAVGALLSYFTQRSLWHQQDTVRRRERRQSVCIQALHHTADLGVHAARAISVNQGRAVPLSDAEPALASFRLLWRSVDELSFLGPPELAKAGQSLLTAAQAVQAIMLDRASLEARQSTLGALHTGKEGLMRAARAASVTEDAS